MKTLILGGNIFLYRLCDQWLEVRFLFWLVPMHIGCVYRMVLLLEYESVFLCFVLFSPLKLEVHFAHVRSERASC